MHVYAHIAPPLTDVQRRVFQDMIASIRETGAYVSSNIERDGVHVAPDVLDAWRDQHASLLEHMDACIIVDGGEPDAHIGFLLAHALAAKKPLLYAYRRGTSPVVLRHISLSALPKFFRIVPFTGTPMKAVTEFLERFDGVVIREVPRIKFTLRITPSIEDFLDAQSQRSGLSKADYLRQQLEKMMSQDATWQAGRRPSSRTDSLSSDD